MITHPVRYEERTEVFYSSEDNLIPVFSIFEVAEVFVVFHTCTGSKDGQNGRIVQENRNLETFVKPQNTNYLRYPIPWLDAFPAACGAWAANLLEGSLEQNILNFD